MMQQILGPLVDERIDRYRREVEVERIAAGRNVLDAGDPNADERSVKRRLGFTTFGFHGLGADVPSRRESTPAR